MAVRPKGLRVTAAYSDTPVRTAAGKSFAVRSLNEPFELSNDPLPRRIEPSHGQRDDESYDVDRLRSPSASQATSHASNEKGGLAAPFMSS